MNDREIQLALAEIGWPIEPDGVMGQKTGAAIMSFQHGYTFIELDVDGVAGPKTQEALHDCIHNQARKCAEFFRFDEFASKGNGWIIVHPRLLNRLDAARRVTGPVRVVSGYRDPAHNTKVGGAKNSQHVYGTAADIRPGIPRALAVELGFSGVGLSGETAIHVDVRAEGPDNTTGARIGAPTIWHY